MNKRIFKKVYKRAERKLLAARKPGDHRSTLDIERQEHVLNPLERGVFLKQQHRELQLFEKIKAELICAGCW